VLCRSCFQKQQANPPSPPAPEPSVADD
jgi:hypothetical protein